MVETMPEVAGRKAELTTLGQVLEQLRAGRGRAVLVEGEAGIGKSSLVAAALASARANHLQVLTGVCDELTQLFPLSAVRQALRIDGVAPPGAPGTAAGAPGPAPVLAVDDPVQAAVEELLGVVHALSAEGPLVLVLEDMHWADAASILWWRRLCRLTAQLPLVLIGTRRLFPPPPGADALGRQLQREGGVVLPLSGLAPDAVLAMAADLVGGVPGPRLLRLLEHAAGNPFYVRELVDEAVRRETLRTASGVIDLAESTDGAGGGLAEDPVLLRAAVESRLDFLPQDALPVLRIAALLDTEFLVNDLAEISGRKPTALVPVLEDAFAAGVLEAAGTRLRFRHGLLRQALYNGIASPVRAVLHRHAARTLMELGAPAERVARQLLAVPSAAVDGLGWEVSWLAGAAEELVRRVPEVTAELLERARRQTWPHDSQRARVEDRLLEAQFVLGRYEQIVQLAREILPLVNDPDRYGQAVWLMAYALLRLRRYQDAEAALAAAGGRSDVSPLWGARFSALRAMVTRFLGPRDRAVHYASAALAAGRELGDAVATAYALHALAIQHFDAGDFRAAARLSGEALRVAEQDPRLGDLWAMLVYNRASWLSDLGDYEAAEKLARDALARGELSGSPRLRRLHGMVAFIAYETGRWDEAIAELDASADVDVDDDEAESPYLRVLVTGHRDERREAEGGLAALKHSTSGFAPPAWRKLHLAANLAALSVLDIERSGDPTEAAALTRWFEPARGDRLPFIHPSLPSFVRLFLAAGDEPGAHAATEAAEREAGRDPLSRKQAVAHWCRGLLDTDPAAVLAAAGSLRDLQLPVLAGSAFEDAAVLLAEAGDAARARVALDDALGLYGGVGATWDARRAASRVRPYGIRPGVRRPRRRPRTGWEALTTMERQVAELLAAGCSNPDIARQLFISRRTVESHVSHILAKLQVASRREVRLAAEHVNNGLP